MFKPDPEMIIQIWGRDYRFCALPGSPSSLFMLEGRRARVFKILNDAGTAFALKVFKEEYRDPHIRGVCEAMTGLSSLPGMKACARAVITRENSPDITSEFPHLEFSVIMPWMDGAPWSAWVLKKKPVTRSVSIGLARHFLTVMGILEEKNLAHGNLSGSNIMVTPQLETALVGLEHIYMPKIEKAGVISPFLPGYGKAGAAFIARGPLMDRFPASIIVAELLGFSCHAVPRNAWKESFFADDEIGKENERFFLLRDALASQWGKATANLFERAWFSSSPQECPCFAEWLDCLRRTSAYSAETAREKDSSSGYPLTNEALPLPSRHEIEPADESRPSVSSVLPPLASPSRHEIGPADEGSHPQAEGALLQPEGKGTYALSGRPASQEERQRSREMTRAHEKSQTTGGEGEKPRDNATRNIAVQDKTIDVPHGKSVVPHAIELSAGAISAVTGMDTARRYRAAPPTRAGIPSPERKSVRKILMIAITIVVVASVISGLTIPGFFVGPRWFRGKEMPTQVVKRYLQEVEARNAQSMVECMSPQYLKECYMKHVEGYGGIDEGDRNALKELVIWLNEEELQRLASLTIAGIIEREKIGFEFKEIESIESLEGEKAYVSLVSGSINIFFGDYHTDYALDSSSESIVFELEKDGLEWKLAECPINFLDPAWPGKRADIIKCEEVCRTFLQSLHDKDLNAYLSTLSSESRVFDSEMAGELGFGSVEEFVNEVVFLPDIVFEGIKFDTEVEWNKAVVSMKEGAVTKTLSFFDEQEQERMDDVSFALVREGGQWKIRFSSI